MLIVHDLIVPPNTPIFNPVREIISPSVGIITACEIYFRDGCLDAVGVRVMEGDRQFIPMPTGKWLRDNNNHVFISELRYLEGAPYRLTIEGYSIALDWSHTISFKFFMEHG